METTKILDNPATAITPKSDKSQIKINTTAICLNGLGRLLTSQTKTIKIRISHKVTIKPLNLNKIMWRVTNGPYPISQKTKRIKSIATSISLY